MNSDHQNIPSERTQRVFNKKKPSLPITSTPVYWVTLGILLLLFAILTILCGLVVSIWQSGLQSNIPFFSPSQTATPQPNLAATVTELAHLLSSPTLPPPLPTPSLSSTIPATNTPPSVTSTPSSEPYGKIVFTCYPDYIYNEICLLDLATRVQTRLTSGNANNYYPSFSPDGSQIVFSSNRDGQFEIYLMNLDGSNQTRLTFDPSSDDHAPAFSPDGTQIAFIKESHSSGQQHLWLMKRDGSGAVEVTGAGSNVIDPTWSPDGTRIAFVSARSGEKALHIYTFTDGSVFQVTYSSPHPNGRNTWSPDGGILAFYSQEEPNEIYSVEIEGNQLTQLTQNSINLAPCFSPDGNWIVFVSYMDGELDLYIMKPDGSNVQQITNNPYSDFQPRWGP
jgi:Tol biopolymer transport system component